MAGKDDWIDDVRRWCFDGADTAAAVGRDVPVPPGDVLAAETVAVETGFHPGMGLSSLHVAFDARSGDLATRSFPRAS